MYPCSSYIPSGSQPPWHRREGIRVQDWEGWESWGPSEQVLQAPGSLGSTNGIPGMKPSPADHHTSLFQ